MINRLRYYKVAILIIGLAVGSGACATSASSNAQQVITNLQKQIQEVANSIPVQLQQAQQVNQKQLVGLQLQVQQQITLLQKQIQQVQNNLTTQVTALQKELLQIQAAHTVEKRS